MTVSVLKEPIGNHGNLDTRWNGSSPNRKPWEPVAAGHVWSGERYSSSVPPVLHEV